MRPRCQYPWHGEPRFRGLRVSGILHGDWNQAYLDGNSHPQPVKVSLFKRDADRIICCRLKTTVTWCNCANRDKHLRVADAASAVSQSRKPQLFASLLFHYRASRIRGHHRSIKMSSANGMPGGASIWQEARNADGRVYYYNVQTKATQWAKPVDLMTPVEVCSLVFDVLHPTNDPSARIIKPAMEGIYCRRWSQVLV
jgi:hypothetical protein